MDSPKNTELESDDELVFFEEDPAEMGPSIEKNGAQSPTWVILMVDDDEQVHQSTILAVGDETVLGRKLRFEHARSAKEALSMMESLSMPPDLAFVDMVMETPDAGLRFAKAVKLNTGWCTTKILLRSGQPGFSNEMDQARSLGVEGFAQKASISRTILIQALVELLSGRSYFMP